MKALSPRLETGRPGQQSGDTDSILKTIFQIFPDLLFYLNEDGVIINYMASESMIFYTTLENCLGRHIMDVLPAHAANLFFAAISKTMQSGQISSLEYDLENKAETRSYSAKFVQIKDANLVVIIRDITEQKRTDDSARRHQKFMDTLQESARQLSRELDSKALSAHITQACIEQYGAQEAWLGWMKSGRDIEELAHAIAKNAIWKAESSIKPNTGELDFLIENKTHLVVELNSSDSGTHQTRAFFPLLSHDQVAGVLGLIVETPDFFTPGIIDFFHAYNLLAGTALQNARLFEDSRRQLSQMQTLRSIDQAILSNLDLKSMTSVILKEAAKHINVDALGLLVLDPKTQTLNFVDGFGFRYNTLKHSHLKIGESFAGQVASEKRVVYVGNLQNDPKNFARAANFREEGFMMYLGTPLIARSEVRGVLEIFQRKPFEPDEDWFTLLETLANQIAIAIDNTLLVKFLQDSNVELNSAYDATIEGLSRALELRDRETEGHTRRVAKMTVELARRMGVAQSELAQIHKGALLHDIGKMGIPDAILLKPGALLPDEWEIMKQHPLFASKLLSQVEHFKQALDIPLYHHEKWDGSGYPFGLKAEQIPAAARLFSIVDVYDALTSDRPYRAAWSVEKTMIYIVAQSGIFFDPAIVPVFRQLILQDTVPLPEAGARKKTGPLL
jgi:HD-GYP domain-containing protein (c-di-GMP phosphodiesterase class II)